MRRPQQPQNTSSQTDLNRAGMDDETVVSPSEAARQRAEGAVDCPQHIARYRIERILGEGGFGQVFLARDESLARLVAIKVPHRDRVSQQGDADEYLAEAQAVASLDHPAIVPVYDVGCTDDGLCYVVSKFIEGGDLATQLKSSRPSHFESALLVATVAEALHHAHTNGLVHRDVKPGNILVDTTGNAFVTDFGLALKDEEFGVEPSYSGTPSYMSPEQVRGEGHRVDGRSDIYSLGVVFYQLLTGTLPFKGQAIDIMLQADSGDVRPPRQRDDSIPKELEWVCLKALSKRASDRYNTAKDMAEDLRRFLGTTETAEGTPTQVTSAAVVAAADSDRDGWKVIPKGLRSFDAHDADYFLGLLPGPRDPSGLPDSIRFWKNRIEVTDADETFSVGLIYGPSGCGKSSFIAAGLIPRLSEQVICISVEAAAQQTENRLLKQLQKAIPDLDPNRGLVDSVASLRRGGVAPEGTKVLIILDQFEQWLHAKADDENSELLQALRHCDGAQVQGLLLVRDDFWMATTRFMRELEIPILEGQNSAAVDLFDLRHATKVLTAFGRAFGALPAFPDELNDEQRAFIQQAISDLTQGGKVISVRLAVFAEMVKGKPWTPATLREVGGTEGVGVTFLEETFSVATAPPEHRFHQKAARGVLKMLLPQSGLNIKGHIRSYQELLVASGYRRPQDFHDLIRLLDGELRLLTPADPEGLETDEGEHLQVAPDQKYYQLTHDYLVRPLRIWLTKKQKETRRGRAQLRLAERGELWTAKPQRRNLPSLWEWTNILCLTNRDDRSPEQRQMMRSATWHHAGQLAAVAAVVFLIALGGVRIRNQFRDAEVLRASAHAKDLVARLLDAEIQQVPVIIDSETDADRQFTHPLLRRIRDDAGQPVTDRTRASLALLPTDPSESQFLQARLLEVEDLAEFSVIRDALRPHREAMADTLWSVLEDGERVARKRFRAALALAAYDSGTAGDKVRWREQADFVANQLLITAGKNSRRFSPLVSSLAAVGEELVAPLVAVLHDTQRSDADRMFAAQALTEYLRERPDDLVELATQVSAQHHAVLVSALSNHREVAVAKLREQLKRQLSPRWQDDVDQTTAGEIDPTLERRIFDAQGTLAETFALCQTMALEEFVSVVELLRPHGYRPVRCRPYLVGRDIQVAAVWRRDSKGWHLAHGLSRAAYRTLDTEMRARGYLPVDIAGYGQKPAETDDDNGEWLTFAAIWAERAPGTTDARAYLGVSNAALSRAKQSIERAGFVPLTVHALQAGDTPFLSAIWVKPSNAVTTVTQVMRSEPYYEQRLAPSVLQKDISISRALPQTPTNGDADDRYLQKRLAEVSQELLVKPTDMDVLAQRGVFNAKLMNSEAAILDLSAVVKEDPDSAIGYQYRAEAYAQLGEASRARQDAALHEQHCSGTAGHKAATHARVAAYLGDEEGMKRFADIVARHTDDDGVFFYDAASAFAVAARTLAARSNEQVGIEPVSGKDARLSEKERASRSQRYADQAIALLRKAVELGYTDYVPDEPDWQAIRNLPEFREISEITLFKKRHKGQLESAERKLKSDPNDDNALHNRVSALVRLGDMKRARQYVSSLLRTHPNTPAANQYAAEAFARMGQAAPARRAAQRHAELCAGTDSHKAQISALSEAYLKDAAGMRRLDDAVAQYSDDSKFLYDAACTYCIASQQTSGEQAVKYQEKAVASLRQAIARGYSSLDYISRDLDLLAIRRHPDYLSLMKSANLNRRYTTVQVSSGSDRISQESHGLAPGPHLDRCRVLAEQGFRPAAISVLALPDADGAETSDRVELVTASVWHRPVVSEEALEKLARRKASAAALLLKLGHGEGVWELLQQSENPRLRTHLIHQLRPLQVERQTIVGRLTTEADASVRQALILSLGQEPSDSGLPDSGPPEDDDSLIASLLNDFRDDPDSGVHSAIDWVLHRWQRGEELKAVEGDVVSAGPPSGRNWYVDSEGHTMAVMRGPVEFIMGSPIHEPDRYSAEKVHRVEIPRSFALGTKEVTVEQFERFQKEHPDVGPRTRQRYSPDASGPVVSLSWYDAAKYCRWLSEKEGIPEDQIPYPAIDDIKEDFKLPADYLQRTGYRLPTEAEWEFSCRAGTRTSRYYGQDENLLSSYAWYVENADERAWPVGMLRPNRLGLFDALGNVREWCHDWYIKYPDRRKAIDVERFGPYKSRVSRGSYFRSSARFVRSAYRSGHAPSDALFYVGFRVARTIDQEE